MPDSVIKTTPTAPKVGTGTYQVGTAPMTLRQKVKEQSLKTRTTNMGSTNQKIKAFAPGQDPKIKGRTSFSDEMGD